MSFVELMVAVVILAFGCLGIAAAGDAAQRAMLRGRLRAEAAARAGVTVDSLRGQACRAPTGATGFDGEQSWTVEARGSLRYLVDSVRADHRRFSIEGAVPCS